MRGKRGSLTATFQRRKIRHVLEVYFLRTLWASGDDELWWLMGFGSELVRVELRSAV